MYVCASCKSKIEDENLKGRIRCIYCGYRIVLKNRPKVIRAVKAI